MRGQIEKESKAEYEQKLADLHAREIKLLIREKLDKRDMPRDLADIITCTDEKDLDAKLDVLQGIYKQKRIDEERAPSGFRPLIGVEPTDKPSKGLDPIRNAMGLN